MNKKFAQEVVRQLPELSIVGDYFCYLPVDHVLTGFVLDRTPSGAYICRFVLPLYDRIEFLHLTFGSRLPQPDDFLYVERGKEKSLATKFVKRIEPYQLQISRLRDLSGFMSYVERELPLSNPWIRRGYALGLIMTDRSKDAFYQLNELSKVAAMMGSSQFEEDVNKISNDLTLGVEVAKGTLLSWEKETKAKYGLII